MEINIPNVGNENGKFKITYNTLIMEYMVMFLIFCFTFNMFVVVFKFNY